MSVNNKLSSSHKKVIDFLTRIIVENNSKAEMTILILKKINLSTAL